MPEAFEFRQDPMEQKCSLGRMIAWPSSSSLVTPAASHDGEDDRVSLVTELSEWVTVDTEDCHLSDCEGPERSFMVESKGNPNQCDVTRKLSASVVACMPLLFGGDAHQVAPSGNITAAWQAALTGFPKVTEVFCLGQVHAKASSSPCSLIAAVILSNDGTESWPSATALRCCFGNSIGFDVMALGPVASGEMVQVVMDFDFSLSVNFHGGQRSAWVMTDDAGEPFGPVLALEVLHC